ncbi:MAG: 4-hydroxythreonine-4-phosphate dehydrogenase PdxA [Thermoleophilia bacterium]|nr:4-hydroxythreonine-4-phosphate dehydrogenase PdxA [Thermoleophilia bacterium]
MTELDRPRIGIVAGDPHGVGSEIILKSLSRPEVTDKLIACVVGSVEHFRLTQAAIGTSLEILEIDTPEQAVGEAGTLEIIPGEEPEWDSFEWGKPSEAAGRVSVDHLRRAAELALQERVQALVYGPLHKGNMQGGGLGFPSEAEFLKDLTGSRELVIFLVGERTMVTRATTHVPLREVPALITKEKVLGVIRMTAQGLRRLSFENPTIGVAALNPHMGEGGKCGTEEVEHIIPAIEAARAEGIAVSDLLPADTLHLAFDAPAPDGGIDAGIYMYHDIAGLCSKIIESFDMFTYTMGLPFPVFTPGHGTRYRRAGRGTAGDEALRNALLFAARTR